MTFDIQYILLNRQEYQNNAKIMKIESELFFLATCNVHGCYFEQWHHFKCSQLFKLWQLFHIRESWQFKLDMNVTSVFVFGVGHEHLYFKKIKIYILWTIGKTFDNCMYFLKVFIWYDGVLLWNVPVLILTWTYLLKSKIWHCDKIS